MRHGSLFSGIGGFDLSAEWMGWDNMFHCEWNPFGQRVLKHYWPNAESFTDITKTDFTKYANRIDVLTGGFPCQPYSTAGKRLGKEDERHLWPEMFRAIREIQPRWVVGENVRGLISWNGGMVFNEVQANLEAEGYEVVPFLIPACAVNAPHRRDRIWFVANREGLAAHTGGLQPKRWGGLESMGAQKSISEGEGYKRERVRNAAIHSRKNNDADSASQRLQGNVFREFNSVPKSNESFPRREPGRTFTETTRWEGFPTQPPICGRNDGIPPTLDGITFSKHRNESIKAYGNAIVPQVAYQIFKAIEQYESLPSNHLNLNK